MDTGPLQSFEMSSTTPRQARQPFTFNQVWRSNTKNRVRLSFSTYLPSKWLFSTMCHVSADVKVQCKLETLSAYEDFTRIIKSYDLLHSYKKILSSKSFIRWYVGREWCKQAWTVEFFKNLYKIDYCQFCIDIFLQFPSLYDSIWCKYKIKNLCVQEDHILKLKSWLG